MNRRDTLLALLAIGAAGKPLSGNAQSVAKLQRVAILLGGTAAIEKPSEDAFLQGLAAFGRKEGANLFVDRRYAEGRVELLPALAEKIVLGNPDVIFAPTRLASEAARKYTRTIPIVFCTFPDPVKAGMVASLARPGGNATGLTQMLIELTGKRLELLKEAVTRLKRVGALSSGDVTSVDQLEELRRSAQRLGIEVILVEANRVEVYAEALAAVRQARVEGLFVLGSIQNSTHRRLIAELCVKHKLPTMFTSAPNTEAGGLMSYAPEPLALFRSAADYVDRIFKGAKPADLPVQQPTEFELVINQKTARAIGLAIPQSLFARANRVIE